MWRNGRRSGFKIPCPLQGVPVRLRPWLLRSMDDMWYICPICDRHLQGVVGSTMDRTCPRGHYMFSQQDPSHVALVVVNGCERFYLDNMFSKLMERIKQLRLEKPDWQREGF
jgi:hypothetical protein